MGWYCARLGVVLSFALIYLVSAAHEPIPNTGRADLLYVQVSVPPGYTLTFLSRQKASVAYKSGSIFGLKPGYGYWLRIEKASDETEVFFPLLEVLDTLSLPARVRASDIPATIAINELDLDRVRNGDMVSKAVVVERDASMLRRTQDAAEAFPLADGENEVMPPNDLLRYAARFGRLVVLVRLGNRQLEPHEWSQPPVPLSAELAAWCRGQSRADLARSRNGSGFIREGGDFHQPAHPRSGRDVGGVEAGDSVAEFTEGNRRRLTVANPVYLAAPRFLTFYQIHTLGRVRSQLAPQPVSLPMGREVMEQAEVLGTTRLQEETQRVSSRMGLHAHLSNVPPIRVVGAQELAATYLEAPGAQSVSVPLGTESVTWLGFDPDADSRHPPLRLQKWASTNAARPGDLVTFFLRYANTSNRPVRDIAITDNLPPRLEYVPGSARSDREAVFVMQENQVGSLILRWEIRDPLPPGQHGTISFQVRVR